MRNEQEILEKLHEKILLILDEIDRICSLHKINYFLDGGSALGAIRHNGFIPWDDDADVGMLREDYNKFIKACRNGALGSSFFLQSTFSESKYTDGFIRIRLNGTRCVIDYHRERGYRNLGIFVDIFPFDRVRIRNLRRLAFRKKLINFDTRLLSNKSCAYSELTSKKSKLAHLFINLLPKGFYVFLRKIHEHYLSSKNAKYCVSTYTSYSIEKKLFDVEVVESTIYHDFCDRKYRIVSQYDIFLKNIYGNYNVLPPKEKRIAHIPSEIEF